MACQRCALVIEQLDAASAATSNVSPIATLKSPFSIFYKVAREIPARSASARSVHLRSLRPSRTYLPKRAPASCAYRE